MRAAEQISENTYIERPEFWQEEARMIGGIEVCDDKTGEPMYTIGMNQDED